MSVVTFATPAEIAWLKKRYGPNPVPTRRNPASVESLHQRGLVSLVWTPSGYWPDGRPGGFQTLCTPLGRSVVDAHRRRRRRNARPGGFSATRASSGPPQSWADYRVGSAS